jgi:hypothetical protein
MQRLGDFVILFCDNCGYEEEIHYKEIERKSLRCPQCEHFVEYEEVTPYIERDDFGDKDLFWDED